MQIADFVVLGFLLILSGFFSGSETALISLNKFKLKKMIEEGHNNALLLEKMLSDPNKMLAAILIGNNLVNVAFAAIITSIAIEKFQNSALGIATGLATLLVLVFGEVVPKSYATRYSEKISLKAAKPIQFIVILFSPIVKIFSILTNILFKITGKEKLHYPFISEEEIKLLMDLGAEEGVIEEEEKEMIHSVIEFGDTLVKEIMTPRTDMHSLDANTEFQEVLDFVIQTGNSRIPVQENSIDNIIGILYAKDLFHHMTDVGKFELKKAVRPALFVPKSKKIIDLYKEMRLKKVQIAMVLDEYGGTAGLVTLEDMIEEIVGEISDEYDVDEHPLQIIDGDTVVVDAKMSIDEVADILEIDLEKDGQDSVGGLVYSLFDRIPKEKDEISMYGVTFTVEKMIGKRILKVRIKKDSASA